MDAIDLLTVLCGVLALGTAAVLAVLCARVQHAARALEEASVAFEEQAIPAITEMREAARAAADEVDRVEDLVDLAGSIGERVDSATEVTYRALTSPVIKGVALASGTRRAARRLRGSAESPDELVRPHGPRPSVAGRREQR